MPLLTYSALRNDGCRVGGNATAICYVRESRDTEGTPSVPECCLSRSWRMHVDDGPSADRKPQVRYYKYPICMEGESDKEESVERLVRTF